MNPQLQICQLTISCSKSSDAVLGLQFQLCNLYDDYQATQELGSFNLADTYKVIWKRPLEMSYQDYLSSVSFYYGYAYPTLTVLKFTSNSGSFVTNTCKKNDKYSQFFKSFEFRFPLVGFQGEFIERGALRSMDFLYNEVIYNYSLGVQPHPFKTLLRGPASEFPESRLRRTRVSNGENDIQFLLFNAYCFQVKRGAFTFTGKSPDYNSKADTNQYLYFDVEEISSLNGTKADVTYDVYNPTQEEKVKFIASNGPKFFSVSSSPSLSCWYRLGANGTWVSNVNPSGLGILYAHCYKVCGEK